MSNTADVLMVDGQFIGYLPPMENFALLWENSSPTSSFAAQTVTLASDDYDFLLFIHRMNNGSTSPCNSLCIPKGQGGNFCVGGTSSNGVIGNDRRITYTDATHIAYGDNNYCYGNNAASVSNTRNIPYKIYGIKTYGQAIGNAGNVYSITEHIVGKWIDGSDLYEKTIDCGALPNATSKNVTHNITNLKMVTEIKGVGNHSTNGNSIPLPYYVSSNGVQIYTNSTHIKVATTTDYSGYNAYITLRYIKN